MAEDLENTQKPKVILNKQRKESPSRQGREESAPPAGIPPERKKVVVVKKRLPAAPNPQVPKLFQPKNLHPNRQPLYMLLHRLLKKRNLRMLPAFVR